MHEKRFEGDIDRLRAPERVERLDVERVTDLFLEVRASGSVLDLGTGTGLFTEAFSRHGLEVAGVDANPEMLIAARRSVPKGGVQEFTLPISGLKEPSPPPCNPPRSRPASLH